ncbi:hypothetical protein SK128_015386, partial [Halocaridina rubra]
MRGVQPDIVYGRTCEELPSSVLRHLSPKVLAAFTGPGGGLASVNRGGHPPLQRDDPDLDFIDADDAAPDAQPNAYVTSRKPPPRKTPYADVAAYFRKRDPKSPLRNRTLDTVSGGRSMDSLDCEAPSWRGEAPSPLSPHPGRAPPTAFLQFGDGPLNYGLTLPPADTGGGTSSDGCAYGSNGVGANRVSCSFNERNDSSSYSDNHVNGSADRRQMLEGSCDMNLWASNNSSTGERIHTDNMGMMETVLVSCRDEGGGTINELVMQPSMCAALDDNLNPLVMVDDPPLQGKNTILDNRTCASDVHHHQQQQVIEVLTDNAEERLSENGNYNPESEHLPSYVKEVDNDSSISGGLASQRAKFLTLDLVEAGAMA